MPVQPTYIKTVHEGFLEPSYRKLTAKPQSWPRVGKTQHTNRLDKDTVANSKQANSTKNRCEEVK